MNATESRYAALLEQRLRAGEILWWKFEGVKLRLADNTFYSPDFFVMLADGTLEVHETKSGFVMADGRAKWKIAAELFPFRFLMIVAQPKKAGGGWNITTYGEAA